MFELRPYTRRNHMANYNPFREMDEFEKNFFADPFSMFDTGAIAEFKTDITDNGDSYLLEADLPGFRKEDIDLHLQDGVLTITAAREKPATEDTYLCRERPMGRFVRAFDVSGIQEDAIRAAYENGVLTLVLPKKGKPEPESFRISIQ